ncbi:MAG: hypothetical protein U0802_16350 [Candidatus Binatia bacterium]
MSGRLPKAPYEPSSLLTASMPATVTRALATGAPVRASVTVPEAP